MDVTLYTRKNCPLCDEAQKVLGAEGIAFREVDIDADPDLTGKFTDDVPVIYIDGTEAFRHRVAADRLRLVMAGWRVIDRHHLEKEFRFPDFSAALAFANRIGAVAEELNHHPDLLVGWGRVRVMTWSHDANAVTTRDWTLAMHIENV